jgi:hypothetical protein
MAQLAVQYPPGLEDLYGYGGQVMGQRYDIARRNEGINQDQALQSLYENQQKLPIELRQMGLNADTTEAQLPGVRAKSWELDRNKQVREGIPLSTEQKAELSKILATTSEEEWKATQAGIKDAMINGNPHDREVARQMWLRMPELETMRQTQAEMSKRQMEIERQRGADRLATVQARVQQIQKKDAALKMSPQQAVVYYRDLRSKTKPDDPNYAVYEALEQAALRDWFASQQLKPQTPGAVNPSAVTGMPAAEPVPAPGAAPLPGKPNVPVASTPKTPYIAGQTYTGKTGTYKYKGGDPADKNNWEKVK